LCRMSPWRRFSVAPEAHARVPLRGSFFPTQRGRDRSNPGPASRVGIGLRTAQKCRKSAGLNGFSDRRPARPTTTPTATSCAISTR
jgi:hypothetical protein